MTRLVFIDTETGGLDPSTDALLSVGLVDWVDGEIRDRVEILVDADGLRCTEQAMAVNKIDLDWHHDQSITRNDAALLIRRFAQERGRPVLVGHNVHFDLGFLRPLFPPAVWRSTFSHRVIDTMDVLAYLGHSGVIPDGIAKLDQALAYFDITMPAGERHTALADALATTRLYTAMVEKVRCRG